MVKGSLLGWAAWAWGACQPRVCLSQWGGGGGGGGGGGIEGLGVILTGADEFGCAGMVFQAACVVFGGEGLQGVLGYPVLGKQAAGDLAERGDGVDEFADEGAGGAFFVGADVFADVGEIQHFAGG